MPWKIPRPPRPEILHSLQIQVPLALLLSFSATAFMLLLLLFQLNTVTEKTSQVGTAAEAGELASEWEMALSHSARERVKLGTLEREEYFAAYAQVLGRIERLAERILESDDRLSPAVKGRVEEIRSLHRRQSETLAESAALPDTVRDPSFLDSLRRLETAARNKLEMLQTALKVEREDKLETLAEAVARARHRMILALLMVVASIGLAVLMLRRKVLLPLRHLEKGAEEIGRGNLAHRIGAEDKTEIGRLSLVFNRMARQLQARKESDSRLRRLQAIDQVVRSVNHEINNPLMIISGNAEYLGLVLGPCLEPPLKQKLDTIATEVQRIFQVTQKLKEIRDPKVETYLGEEERMLDLPGSAPPPEEALPPAGGPFRAFLPFGLFLLSGILLFSETGCAAPESRSTGSRPAEKRFARPSARPALLPGTGLSRADAALVEAVLEGRTERALRLADSLARAATPADREAGLFWRLLLHPDSARREDALALPEAPWREAIASLFLRTAAARVSELEDRHARLHQHLSQGHTGMSRQLSEAKGSLAALRREVLALRRERDKYRKLLEELEALK